MHRGQAVAPKKRLPRNSYTPYGVHITQNGLDPDTSHNYAFTGGENYQGRIRTSDTMSSIVPQAPGIHPPLARGLYFHSFDTATSLSSCLLRILAVARSKSSCVT